ncbi:MAG: 2-keto-4-pentenoate hydratase [Alphaproteobacteria bacterium]|nr:MAG: 2-keto-4-pentenoate hydratase [Alphaproteobacteria bacterium]
MAKVDRKAIEAAAKKLREAHETGKPCAPLNTDIPGDDLEAGYAIQDVNTDFWVAQGRRLVGRKTGLTAKAVQKQLGVDQPDYGMLFADMAYGDGEEIPMSRLIQPKIEGEIAFVLGRDLNREGLTMADVLSAVDYAVVALEIVDSRIADWQIRIMDTIADNASSGLYVLGTEPRALGTFDPWSCGMVIEHKGEPISVGAGAACLGNPLTATLWLARKMVEVGRPLMAGDTILSGALGPMQPITPGGTYELRISGLGSVRASFSNLED